jgi:hypothetical protein
VWIKAERVLFFEAAQIRGPSFQDHNLTGGGASWSLSLIRNRSPSAVTL